MARLWRAFHEGPVPPRSGESLALSREESHHVARVLRLRVGEALSIFDGSGREWGATLVESAGDQATVAVGAELGGSVEPVLDLKLYQGVCRATLLEWVIEKGTEIGVAAIALVATERSERVPPRAARLRRIAVESCKQSGRRRLPGIDFIPVLPQPGASTLALVLDPAAQAAPLAAHLACARPAEVWLLAGPEAGLTSAEVERCEQQGWRRASLGPRTLRTETAGLVAATIVLHRWGDLGRSARDD